MDTRNVVDKYKHVPNAKIKEELDADRFNYAVICSNVGNNFNVGSILRCANAFGAKQFGLHGKGKYDRRSTVGTHKYIDVLKFPSLYELREFAWQMDTIVIGVEQTPSSAPYNEFDWIDYISSNLKIVLLFGSEDNGLSDSEMRVCDHLVSIPQYGSVRSINVACAASIIMSHLATQFNTHRLTRSFNQTEI
jgi:tRNA G18 (ribose-2'-O)-methylase SpoU